MRLEGLDSAGINSILIVLVDKKTERKLFVFTDYPSSSTDNWPPRPTCGFWQ